MKHSMNRAMRSLQERAAASAPVQWFREQTTREQRLLLGTGGFLLAVMFWLLIWQPVQDRLQVAEQRHARALADHDWLRANEARLAALARRDQTAAGPRSGQALLGTISSSAREHGLSLSRFTPEGRDALSVSLDDVPFDALVQWLAALEDEEGIRATTATIDAAQANGRVRARLVLQ